MSEHPFFDFSTGLARPLAVPPGTLAAMRGHLASLEQMLGLRTTQFLDNPPHWDLWHGEPRGGWPATLTDEVLCQEIERHNAWVRWVYARFAAWSATPPDPCVPLTPEGVQTVWYGLERLEAPPARWTPAYYRARMEAAYETMRGRPCEGVALDAAKLTPKQAAAVINLFSVYLDVGDLRLDVPYGHDGLASSVDGGYLWCSSEGATRAGCSRAMHPDDVWDCRRRRCPLREEEDEEEDNDD